MNKDNKENILEIANDLTSSVRPNDYGHPAEHLSKTGAIWAIYIKEELERTGTLSAETVSLMFALDKIVRESFHHKNDNLVDLAGYARCVERIKEYRE